MVLTIRPAQRSDVPLLFEMLHASAVDQGFPELLAVTEADLVEDGFGARPRFQAIFAEIDSVPAAMALYFFTYSTWVNRNVLYLEDLYVDVKYRRAGVATALLEHLAGIARQEGCGRMQWLVHRENEAAIRLYRSLGAHLHDDWILTSRTVEAS